MGSPTSRSLAALRYEGWQAGVVEKWIPQAGRRVDLGGGIDIVAWRAPGPDPATGWPLYGGILAVQACAGASHAARRTKLLALPAMREWVAAGGHLEIWSWTKKGPRGRRKLWACRREALLLADFDAAAHEVRIEIEARG